MLSVAFFIVMLNVIMMSVVMPNVIMLSVVVPLCSYEKLDSLKFMLFCKKKVENFS